MQFSFKTKVLNFVRNIFKIPFLESLLVKKTKGKSVNTFWCKVMPNYYQYKHPSWRSIVRDNIKLHVDISDWMGYCYYFAFQNELGALFDLCNEGYNVVDIGANTGWTVLKLSQKTKTGKVIGFEPDTYNYSQCKKNIELNKNISNITVLPFGLGENNMNAQIEVRAKANRGGNRIATKKMNDVETIQIKKLDEVKEVRSLSKIDLIKIDVEGYELKVLKGAETILLTFKPTLFIEVDNNNLSEQGDSASLLITYLNHLGYNKIINAETNTIVTPAIDFTNCHYDIIAK